MDRSSTGLRRSPSSTADGLPPAFTELSNCARGLFHCVAHLCCALRHSIASRAGLTHAHLTVFGSFHGHHSRFRDPALFSPPAGTRGTSGVLRFPGSDRYHAALCGFSFPAALL